MSYMLEFRADGRPRSKGSRVTQRVPGQRRIRSAAVQEQELDHWTGTIRSAASEALADANRTDRTGQDGYPRAWRGPVLVLARYRLVRPQRLANTLDAEPATTTPDGDKLERALWDALTGLAFADDRQVVGWAGLKTYASPLEHAGVSARVIALEDETLPDPGLILGDQMRKWL